MYIFLGKEQMTRGCRFRRWEGCGSDDTGEVTLPLEAILQRSSAHPVAVTGIVENGLVKPLDPADRLPEHASVIIVTSQGG